MLVLLSQSLLSDYAEKIGIISLRCSWISRTRIWFYMHTTESWDQFKGGLDARVWIPAHHQAQVSFTLPPSSWLPPPFAHYCVYALYCAAWHHALLRFNTSLWPCLFGRIWWKKDSMFCFWLSPPPTHTHLPSFSQCPVFHVPFFLTVLFSFMPLFLSNSKIFTTFVLCH